jgi:hypothetical protein
MNRALPPGDCGNRASDQDWAPQYEAFQARFQKNVLELRGAKPATAALHARLPSAVAQLRTGWESWLEFAREVGAIEDSEQVELLQRGKRALDEVAANQISYHQASDPAHRFVSLVQVALVTGRAHIADREGSAPESPERWGWRRKSNRTWLPQGTRIGWINGSDVFLEPTASYQIAQHIAGRKALSISPQTLRQRLSERGLIASVDVARKMLLVRRTLEHCPRKVLHIKASDLLQVGTE